MPGVEFLLGGAVAALAGPRATFAVAGAGVLIVLAIGSVAVRRAAKAGVDRAAAHA